MAANRERTDSSAGRKSASSDLAAAKSGAADAGEDSGDVAISEILDNPQEFELLKPIFQFFDTDSDGYCEAEQIQHMLVLLGYPHPGVGFDKGPRMNLRSLLIYIKTQTAQPRSGTNGKPESELEMHVRRTYRMMDKQLLGRIDARTLHKYLLNVDVVIPLDQVERITELIATGDDPRFVENEFVEYVLRCKAIIEEKERNERDRLAMEASRSL